MANSRLQPTRVRHKVLWLIVAAYMITYMDRVIIATAAPSIQAELGLSLLTMGWVFSAFQIGYALFQVPGGWLGDRVGARRALSAVVIWWSAFTAATAAMSSAGTLIVCRFLFGVGEAGAFPIATRSLSAWILPSERGWAQGITHAGARLGGAMTPVLVVYLIARVGWRAPFLIFASAGVVWATFWYWYYRDRPIDHRGVNCSEQQLIITSLGNSAESRNAVPWRRLLSSPQIWVLSGMYFCYAYSMGIFLTWFPKYLHDARAFDLAQMGVGASLPLMAGVAGDIAGGWISDRWLKRTGDVRQARRTVAIIGFLIAGVSIPLAAIAVDPVLSVGCFCLSVLGLELTVGISWAVTLDIGGAYAGSVSAVMNTFGNAGGAVASALTGYIVIHSGWHVAFFIPAGLSVTAALLFVWIDASKPLHGVDSVAQQLPIITTANLQSAVHE